MNRFKTSKFKNTTPKIPKKDVSNVILMAANTQGWMVNLSSDEPGVAG